MDYQTRGVRKSSDTSISSDNDGLKQQKKSNMELEKDHGEV
jgi:hypothetical protein